MDWETPPLAEDVGRSVVALLHGSDETLRKLAGLELFDGCSRSRLVRLARKIRFRSAPKGTVLVAEGSAADRVVIVLHGCVKVKQKGVRLESLRRGESFGELAVLNGQPYPTSLVAGRDAELAVMTGEDFLDLLDDSPCLAHRVLRRIADRSRRPVA